MVRAPILRLRCQGHRNKVLIPASAHGTNPASAIQAGFVTVTCACDEQGNVEMADLRAKAEENKDELAALMITYPSTHGIFETEIKEICDIIHACGAQVYMDGANMNAQVGLTNPGFIGADVCHLNSGYGVVLSLNVLIWMNCVLVYFIYLIAIMYKFQMCDLLILRFGQLTFINVIA